MTVRGVFKTTVITLVALTLLLLIVALLILRALVEPDSDKFGKVQDEAMKAGLTRTHFAAADEGYFTEMDKGLLEPAVISANGTVQYPPQIVALAKRTGLSNEEIRQHAIKGQNTWTVWTGGNDLFWDRLVNISIGTFDLLKVISSHEKQAYGRRNRWHYLGLVNEPCFEEATKESAAASGFGLWLDRRDDELRLRRRWDLRRHAYGDRRPGRLEQHHIDVDPGRQPGADGELHGDAGLGHGAACGVARRRGIERSRGWRAELRLGLRRRRDRQRGHGEPRL